VLSFLETISDFQATSGYILRAGFFLFFHNFFFCVIFAYLLFVFFVPFCSLKIFSMFFFFPTPTFFRATDVRETPDLHPSLSGSFPPLNVVHIRGFTFFSASLLQLVLQQYSFAVEAAFFSSRLLLLFPRWLFVGSLPKSSKWRVFPVGSG